jgi:hypothetical protein
MIRETGTHFSESCSAIDDATAIRNTRRSWSDMALLKSVMRFGL